MLRKKREEVGEKQSKFVEELEKNRLIEKKSRKPIFNFPILEEIEI